MGVPAFFRWLSRKYPSIVVSCIEDKVREIQGMKIPVDATQPNPNEVEFDNLYLDMNGIIHPCCHPEDKPAPKDEDEMMEAIFEYIDRIFNIIRPRRLLYMAIDGVAPRAKMNQQRSRRFRASKESVEKSESISQIRSDLEARGVELPPLKSGSAFDSNCITPGTTFMARLAVCLQFYIHNHMNSNPAWQGIKVILSDANVPGEGEHKIMDYIRRQRAQPDHDPNTHHCLYGADADLIMLGLATHEPHFTILREEFKPGQPRPCEICGQYGHEMKECAGTAREKSGQFDEMANSEFCPEKNFIFIRLCVLREYLERELRIDGLPFPYDFERAVDDWVFMCFFVGNDFLPHLPSLEIREGAIDRLIRLYKNVVPQTHGYLTDNGVVNLPRVQLMLSELGKVEDEIFKKRREREKEFRRRDREKKRAAKRRSLGDNPLWTPQGQFAPTPLGSSPSPVQNARHEAYQMRQMASMADNQAAATDLRQWLKKSRSKESFSSSSPSPQPPVQNGTPEEVRMYRKRKMDGQESGRDGEEEEEEELDEVRLWESGWKERYYHNKFGVPPDDREFMDKLTEAYTQGLCWVLGYYYQGCQSWRWFYPFHYAPFASDFRQIGKLKVVFDRSTAPFRPLEQLMGVFPAASSEFLPLAWRDLMQDEDSPIIDFYPINFKVDLNGKKYLWQGVALLPFVDEDRLRHALSDVYHTLTPNEVERNSLGSDRIFVYRQNRLYPFLRTLYENYGKDSQTDLQSVKVNPEFTQGVRGQVTVDDRMQRMVDDGNFIRSPIPSLPDIKRSYVIGAKFSDPDYPHDHVFEVSKLLPGVRLPDRTLRAENWHDKRPGSYRPNLGFSTPPARSQPYRTPDPAQRMIKHSLSDPRSQGSYDSASSYRMSSWYDQQQYMRGHGDRQSSAPSVTNWNPLPPPHPRYPPPPHPPPPYHYPPPQPYGYPQRPHFLPPQAPPSSSRYNYRRPGYPY